MESRIETLPPQTLVGMSLEMTQVEDRTQELWQRFLPRRKEIAGRLDQRFYSLQVADSNGRQITDRTPFVKWAAVAVKGSKNVPDEMSIYRLGGGLYAVFTHRGPAKDFSEHARYIYGQWLPNSDYALDDREHFGLFADTYRPDRAKSVEEIWIPIRKTR